LSGMTSATAPQFNAKALETWAGIKALNQEARTYLKDFKGKKNKDKREALKQARDEAKKAFEDCKKASHIVFAQARIDSYKKILSNWETKISNMKSKGLDTAEMTGIIEQARKDILAPLETIVSGGDFNAIKDALKTHCIYDGCDTGNFHLEAKMEIARFNAMLAKIKAKATETGLAAEWQSAKDSIDSAKTALDSLGTAKYTQETKAAVWDKIKEAANKIKELIKKKKGGNQQ